MRRFILIGAPGAGKTAVIRQLEIDGFGVVEEAVTDLIALAQVRGIDECWRDPSFIDSIVDPQRRWQIRTSCQPDEVQFADRSAICTGTLPAWLGHSVSDKLSRELERIKTGQKRVFCLTFLSNSREEAYRSFGYEIMPVEPAHSRPRGGH
jgi:predicted ATPase